MSVLLWGDPHVKTLDGTNYTFNGVGEYTLLKTDNNEFVLQARTEVVAQGGLNVATVFTVGVAKEAGTDTVEIRLKSGGMKFENSELSLSREMSSISAAGLNLDISCWFCDQYLSGHEN